jgi:protein-S-isoprenylcysteine O-methyltransferase Ste14
MAKVVTWACWGVVVATWIAGAAVGARPSRGRRLGSRSGVLWQIGVVAAALLVYRLARPDLARATDRSVWIELPGLVLLVASTAFTLWARVELGRMWSASPDMLRADHVLRTDGPYAITRHPIYTGLLGMLVRTALLNGLGLSLGLPVVGVAFLIPRIPVEERLMIQTFPEEYARYRDRVPRLLPGIHRIRRSH